jgi:hypothetical protein
MAFTFRQLQFFVAAAEQRSVSGAAQKLSISQSSVTEAIKELERDLGVGLFERHARGLNITHAPSDEGPVRCFGCAAQLLPARRPRTEDCNAVSVTSLAGLCAFLHPRPLEPGLNGSS